jgi:hypothetical protein
LFINDFAQALFGGVQKDQQFLIVLRLIVLRGEDDFAGTAKEIGEESSGASFGLSLLLSAPGCEVGESVGDFGNGDERGEEALLISRVAPVLEGVEVAARRARARPTAAMLPLRPSDRYGIHRRPIGDRFEVFTFAGHRGCPVSFR